MDVATLARSKKKLNICTVKKKGVAFGGALEDLDSGGIFLLHIDIVP
jgi:hypothetical protein